MRNPRCRAGAGFPEEMWPGEGGRLVFAGLANLLPGAGLPPPGGGAPFPLVRRRPVGAHLASAAWAGSFLRGFCGVPRSGTRSAQSTFCSVLVCFFPAVIWFWVGCGRGQISDGKDLASVSSGHGGNEALPCRVSEGLNAVLRPGAGEEVPSCTVSGCGNWINDIDWGIRINNLYIL